MLYHVTPSVRRALRCCKFLLLLPIAVTGMGLPHDGLVLHLDVATIHGVADGAALHRGWMDRSDNGHIASSNQPPLFIADAGSNYPALRFNGTDQYLQADVPLGNAASVFIVFTHRRAPALANYRDILIAASGSGTNLSLAASRSSTTVPDYPSFNALTGSGIDVRTWVNGHETTAATGDMVRNRFYLGSAVYTAMPTTNALLIGARGSNGFNAGRNDIREVLVYDRALSDAERLAVQQYLGAKHDIEVVRRPLDHPVEAWPHVLGAQQFGVHYSFGESGISTLDYARATLRQGNRVIKFRLSSRYASEDGFTPTAGINSLVKLARDQPEVKAILDLPLTDYLFWVSSFSVPSWQNQLDAEGLRLTAQNAIYAEVYDLAVHLLTTYSGTGKRFYLGNWEGDWMLSGTFRDDPRTIPANRIQGMIDWANTRQRAIDDAKAATPHHDVDVWFYLEMNKADWMRQGLPCVANSVIPAMPKLDMVSISSYSVHKDGENQAPRTRVHADLDLVQARMNAKPDPSIPGSRIIIGEYGWIYNATRYPTLADFAHAHRITARNFVSWPNGTLRFILQWQFFNAATISDTNPASKEMNQIGPANDLRPMYYLHENFYRLMRRWVDDYHARTGRLPDARAYADQANHVLGFVSVSEYTPVLRFTTYAAWKNYHFRDATEGGTLAISGPYADPYSSGLSNLLRYALGLGKFGYDATRMPQMRRLGDTFVLALPLDRAKTDLRWRVEAGTRPGLWTATPFDSALHNPVLTDGWLHLNTGVLTTASTPEFYRLNLQLIP
jgi:hypothetical protein